MNKTLSTMIALALAAATAACAPASDDEVVVESSSSELTYDIDGRAYIAQFELLAQARLTERAQDEVGFHDLLSFVYGDYDPVVAETLRQQMVAGDFSWAPNVQLVDESVLAGGIAAYSEQTGLVYLNENATHRIQRTVAYLEEIGHHLDVLLKDSDTAGDEGGLFRMAVFGAPISAEKEAQLRTEDDRGTIVVGGARIDVEYFFLFDWLDDAWEAIVDAWDWATPRVFWFFVDQMVIVYDGIKTLANTIPQAVESFALGIEQLAEGNLSAGFKNLFEGAIAITLAAPASFIITVVLHEIQAIQTLIFGPGRPLTDAEKAAAYTVFGHRWWLEVIRVVEGKTEAGVFGVHDDPFTLEFTIYLKDRAPEIDLMIHEITHSFQFASSDGTYKLLSVTDRIQEGQAMYDWVPAANQGKLFPRFGVEQQASFVEDAFMDGCFDNAPWQQCYVDGVNRTELFLSARRAIDSGVWVQGVLPPPLITAAVL